MFNGEFLRNLEPFFEEIQKLIDDSDDGTGIAALVGIRRVSPAYLSTIAQVARLYDGSIGLAVNPKLAYYVYMFALLHEVFHVKLEHLLLSGFLVNNVHNEFENPQKFLWRKILATTEMEASICAGVALFWKDVIERTGFQTRQEIEDAAQNIRNLDKTLANLRFRWNLTRSSAIMDQIKECEETRRVFADMLERLQGSLEFQDPPETLEDIAKDYGVPVSFLACNLEGFRRMGYTVIPVQHIDWENMFSMDSLKRYMEECL
ncbi:MAG: hypothetical protein IIZ54_02055 [Selenomonadaceae bacterium]|nr:hypothetical protein [Selenomonadaceae bacterium]